MGSFQLGVVAPGKQADVALQGGGQLQVGRVGIEHAGDEFRFRAVRRTEEHPELVLDHVERDLAAAHRSLHEAHHDELRIVEHEAVTRVDRQVAEGCEGVGGQCRIVAGQGGDSVVQFQEPATYPLHALGVELQRHEGLGDRCRLEQAQPVPDARHAGVVERAARGDDVDRLAGGAAAAHQLEVASGRLGEVELAGVPVLVDVAGDQPLLRTVAVQEALPLGDAGERGGRRRGRRRVGRAALQPARQRLPLGRGESRQRERHAALRVLAGVVVEALGGGAYLLALQREIDVAVGQAAAVRPGMGRLEIEHAVHDTALAVRFRRLGALVEDREETLLPPFGIALGIEAEAGRRVGEQSVGIHLGRVGAARDAGIARQVELAGGVVAGVAGDAALVEQRPHFVPVVRRAADGGGRVIEAHRIRIAETVVELQCSDNGGATRDKSDQQWGQQAHGMNQFRRRCGILAQALRTGRP